MNILVTGAAGSIGAALLARLQQDSEKQVTGIDLVTGTDIRNRGALRQVFESVQPGIVFHAAALKHVPELETQPLAAIETNVLGTVNVACVARELAVPKVVLLSTDKAVCPISVMGKTKRLAEQVWQNMKGSGTEFITVRFGNVLGSNGSVVPIFENQIKRGEPVTVTHREMRRYFLNIEAALDVLLLAAANGENGEIFVPEMGEPRSILDIAVEMIEGREIPIEFIGIRPGEKLMEQLWDPASETLVRKVGASSVYRPLKPAPGIWTRIAVLQRTVTELLRASENS